MVMKVLYIFDEDGKYGGPRAGLEMIKALKEQKDIKPIIITSKKNELNDICDIEQFENYVTGHHKYTYVKSNSIIKNVIKYIPRYIRYRYGIYRAQKKILKYINLSEIDLIHCNISGVDLGAIIGKKYNIPNILHIREYGEGEQYFRVKSYRPNYIDFLNNNVSKFVAISNTVGKFWIEKGIDKNKLVNIYDGLYLSDISLKENFDYENEKIKFIMLGSIHQGKGQRDLIEACSKLDRDEKSKIKIDIIGNGFKEEEKIIHDLIKRYSLQDIITFKNYDDDIRSKLHLYDIGVNCSFAEGFGRVTVEYMAAGLCVIASNRGANEEIVRNNENGIIYDKNNIDSLVEKIRLVINNCELRKKIAKNALKDARKYDISEKCLEIYDMYKEYIK